MNYKNDCLGPDLYGYVLNDPINLVDPLGLKTTGQGVTMSVSVLGFTGSATIQSVEDDTGDFGIAMSYSGGGAAEILSGSVMRIDSSTNADSINQLNGNSVILGAGGSEYAGYNHELEMASNYIGHNSLKGLDIGVIPVNIYGTLSNTVVLNFGDMLDEILNILFSNESACKK